jgi:hypothetical protein
MEKKKTITSFCAVVIFTQKPHTHVKGGEYQTKLMASSSELALFPPLPSPRGEGLYLLHREQKE